jgi:hypothetical protein
MSYSINLDKVISILHTSVEKDSLRPFREVAESLLNEHLLPQDVSLLSSIGVWLTAHFATIKYRQTGQERIEENEEKYYAKIGYGLEGTSYGQQAILLDPTGILKQISNTRRQASIKAL